MKPQCETAAACLRELARVMEQFWITSPIEASGSKYVIKDHQEFDMSKFAKFQEPERWRFAIAEVEGKPVFIGDEFYDGNAMKHKILGYEEGWFMSDGSLQRKCLFLNPPKPKPVLVELAVGQAELGAKLGLTTDIAQGCRKALEKQ